MANLFDRFEKEIKGKKDTFSDFSSNLSSLGDFSKHYGINVILKSWYNILTIPLKTYDNEPETGSNLYRFIFREANKITIDQIRNEIQTSIMNQDDRAIISNIDIKFFKNKKGFKVRLEVKYKGDTSNLDIKMTEIKYQNLL